MKRCALQKTQTTCELARTDYNSPVRMRYTTLVLLNLLVLAAGAWWFARRPAATATDATPAALAEAKRKGVAPFNPNKPAAAGERVVYVTNRFHWSEVESADYRKYIANLRAIGCPEPTIKDLIVTDIMKLYALRRGDLHHNGREFKYWETNEKRTLTKKQFTERESQLAAIDKEIPGVLRELLGVNYERELNKYFVDTRDEERKLAFLDEAKLTRVLGVRDLIEGLREQALAGARDGQPGAAELEKLAAIEKQRHDLLAQVLSKDELARYELAMSPTAERLRGELVGFNPTEDEFRAIHDAWREHEARFAFSADTAARDADRQRVEQEIKNKLGNRADDYARAQNRDFREIVLFSQQNELPPAMAKSLNDMREAALSVRDTLLSDSQLPPARRDLALQTLREEIEKTMRASLGDQLYASFQNGPGQWINSLGSAMVFSTR
ncbi:MAG: hypothetical protein HY301_00935 [Verrucomicrobia bacterium]|nr:hypothetical protein [Verrucomicrobiota bacterium]